MDAETRRRGLLLKAARKRKGWTQQQVAEALRVSARTVGDVERGRFAKPSTLPAMLDLYGLQEEDLLNGQAHQPNDELGAFEQFPREVFVALLVWGHMLQLMEVEDQNEKIAAVTRLLVNDGRAAG